MRGFLAIVTLLVFCGVSSAAFAQTGSDKLYEAALRQGNTVYNSGDYEGAVDAYTSAIQVGPQKATAYRNLARALFWSSQYAAAAQAYDHYLRLAPNAEDIEQVKAERRLAAERAGDAVYTLPEPQRLALEALERELESGHAYTSGGGGAWALYETLLRTGYAEPGLAQVRSRLARRMLDEFDAHVTPTANQLTPRLDLEGWQLQAERLTAAQTVADDPVLHEVLKRRSSVVEAAISMLTSQWSDAASLARLARVSNPDLDFLVWFEATSLIHAERYDEALTLLDDVARNHLERDREKLDYVRVLRALALQRLDRLDEAASIYLDVLRR